MSKIYDYQIGLVATEVERLNDATTALHGLSEIRTRILDDSSRPEWWTDYHEHVIAAATRLASGTLAFVIDEIRDQVVDQDKEANRG